MRIYDPRLGKFLSVDPITQKYPELTPYQFASNRPIDGIDQDDLEWCPPIPKFPTNQGHWSDYTGAVCNGVINVANLVPELWNSGVSTVQSLKKGTYLSDVGGEFKQMGIGIKDRAVSEYNYTISTPFTQQLKDAGNTLISPQTLETATTFFIGSKIPVGGGKGNLLKVETTTTTAAKTIIKADATAAVESNAALAARYTKNRPQFRQGTINKVWEAAKDVNGKVFDPNTFEQLTWDKFKTRYDQWHMGHKPGQEYRT